jgi:hypothetical protein
VPHFALPLAASNGVIPLEQEVKITADAIKKKYKNVFVGVK